jgi:hypothetical protein
MFGVALASDVLRLQRCLSALRNAAGCCRANYMCDPNIDEITGRVLPSNLGLAEIRYPNKKSVESNYQPHPIKSFEDFAENICRKTRARFDKCRLRRVEDNLGLKKDKRCNQMLMWRDHNS